MLKIKTALALIALLIIATFPAPAIAQKKQAKIDRATEISELRAEVANLKSTIEVMAEVQRAANIWDDIDSGLYPYIGKRVYYNLRDEDVPSGIIEPNVFGIPDRKRPAFITYDLLRSGLKRNVADIIVFLRPSDGGNGVIVLSQVKRGRSPGQWDTAQPEDRAN